MLLIIFALFDFLVVSAGKEGKVIADDRSGPYVYPVPSIPFDGNKDFNFGKGNVDFASFRDPSFPNPDFHSVVGSHPLLSALLVADTLGVKEPPQGYNHADHLPVNPYLALLLSQYGRYVPLFGMKTGIYGHNAANNLHNNRPFGRYKIVGDAK